MSSLEQRIRQVVEATGAKLTPDLDKGPNDPVARLAHRQQTFELRKSRSTQSQPSKSKRTSLEQPKPSVPHQPGSALNSSVSSMPSPPRRTRPETDQQLGGNARAGPSRSPAVAPKTTSRSARDNMLAAIQYGIQTLPRTERNSAAPAPTPSRVVSAPFMLATTSRSSAAAQPSSTKSSSGPSGAELPRAIATKTTGLGPSSIASESKSAQHPPSRAPIPPAAPGAPTVRPIPSVPLPSSSRPPKPVGSNQSTTTAAPIAPTSGNSPGGPSNPPFRPPPPAPKPRQAVTAETKRRAREIYTVHDQDTGIDDVRYLPTSNSARLSDPSLKPEPGCYCCGRSDHKTLYPDFCIESTRWFDNQPVASKATMIEDKRRVVMSSGRVTCHRFMWQEACDVVGERCEDFHGCSLCRSVLHHPGDCAMFQANGRPQPESPERDPPVEMSAVYLVDKGVANPRRRRMPQADLARAKAIAEQGSKSLWTPLGTVTSTSKGVVVPENALPPIAQDVLGGPCHDFFSRVVSGRELDDAPPDLDKAKVYALLKQIHADFRLDLSPSRLKAAQATTLAKSVAFHKDLQGIEARASAGDPLVRTGITATTKRLKGTYSERYQHPDGLPELAPLLCVGNYPIGHGDNVKALTQWAFSTRLLVKSGLTSNALTRHYGLAFINLIPIHLPVEKGGIPSYVNGTHLPLSIRRRCKEEMKKRLNELRGNRLVIVFGEENARVVKEVVEDAKARGSPVYSWVKQLPHITGVEAGVDNVGLSAARALAEGEGKLGVYCGRSTGKAQHKWFAAALGDISKSVSRQPGLGKVSADCLKFNLVDNHKAGAILFLSLPHPQTANLYSTAVPRAAVMDVGTRYAVDFVRGFHHSGIYQEQTTWAFMAACQNAHTRNGRTKEGDRDPRVCELRYLEELQAKALDWHTSDNFRFPPRHLSAPLLSLYRELGYVEKGEGVQWDGPSDDVVGQLLWLLETRAAAEKGKKDDDGFDGVS